MIEAAGIPETFFTVWHNVFERGALESGRVVSGSRRHERHRRHRHPARQGFRRHGHRHRRLGGEMRGLRELGADVPIDYTREDFAAVIKPKPAAAASM